jgi:hypothetical protein
LSPYTLFSLNTPVFPQILLFSPDTPVVSIYSVFLKIHMETTGVSRENRSIWGKTGAFRENRVYGDNGSIWRKQEYLGKNGSI